MNTEHCYILSFGERAIGPVCNDDYVIEVHSNLKLTLNFLTLYHIVNLGYCSCVDHQDCCDCGGSHIENFKVEDYTPERARNLGLVGKVCKNRSLDQARKFAVRETEGKSNLEFLSDFLLAK